MSKPKLTMTTDLTKKFIESIDKLDKNTVLVGVPVDTSARANDNNQPMNNATLLAMANYGSAANNIPPWPVMKIGIEAAKEEITDQFKKAAQSVLSKGASVLDQFYNRAGIIASTSIKKVINDQVQVPPDKPEASTIAARERRGFQGTKYWIVTGQLRNSITYILKGGK